MNVQKLQQPDLDDYHRASRLGEPYWPYLQPLNTDRRFGAFQELGVELVVAHEGNTLQAACFVLPDSFSRPWKTYEFVWLFHLASRREARNAGALLLLAMREWYPAMMSVGVTEEAAGVYAALGWQTHTDVWRCVHPIDIAAVREQEGLRLRGATRTAVGALGAIYGAAARLAETGIALGAKPSSTTSQPETARTRLIQSYLPVHTIEQGEGKLQAVDIGGIARIVHDDTSGLGRHRAHARLCRSLRKTGARLVESVALTASDRRSALLRGYVPVRMPIYAWQQSDELDGFFDSFGLSGFGFGDCDKIL